VFRSNLRRCLFFNQQRANEKKIASLQLKTIKLSGELLPISKRKSSIPEFFFFVNYLSHTLTICKNCFVKKVAYFSYNKVVGGRHSEQHHNKKHFTK
jgi:hypothetical protein